MASRISDPEAAARLSAGLRVSESLHTAEAAVDAALVEAQALTVLLPAQGDPHATGRGPAVTPFRAVSRARVNLARAHRTLAEVARRIGLDETDVGPLDKPEDTPPIGGGPRRRRPA